MQRMGYILKTHDVVKRMDVVYDFGMKVLNCKPCMCVCTYVLTLACFRFTSERTTHIG
jgi:hypothetical protein